ncbi:MAG: hypothetical protein JO042_05985 [Sinobacteraceae bacterium]|nr:hypothetical protein [Nevskiaceae bacterium]
MNNLMNDDVLVLRDGTDTALAEIQARIAEIQHALAAMQYLSSGTLLKRTKRCGNPRCRCATDPSARHGPYYEWSYKQGGKLRHLTLTARQAELMRLAIANSRRVKKLLRAWEQQTLRLIELTEVGSLSD